MYTLKVFIADARGDRIEIRGSCISACTLFLGAKDVCVHPDAMLWFHAAKTSNAGQIDEGATRTMSLYWGPKVAAWAEAVGVTQSLAFTRRRALSGIEAISLGVKRCHDEA